MRRGYMLNAFSRSFADLILRKRQNWYVLCCEIILMYFLYLCFAGESGLGKSTLINSLFLTDLYSPEYPGPSHRIKKTVQVRSASLGLFVPLYNIWNFNAQPTAGWHMLHMYFLPSQQDSSKFTNARLLWRQERLCWRLLPII